MLLEVEGLSVQFGGLRALASLSFNIAEGQIVGLVGPNGAGKSTLVNAVSGVIGRQPGQIRFGRRDINGLSPSRIARLGLARTFQLVQPFRGLTAIECVTLGGLYGSEDRRPRGVAAARRMAEEALDFAGLSEVAGSFCDILNASQRRRLEIARALAARPRLILLDECLSGLNSIEIQQGIVLVRALRERGIAILIIEHLMRVIGELADHVIVLNRGEKIADGEAASVLTNERALDVYFGPSAA